MKFRKVKILPQGHTESRTAESSSEFQTQQPRVFPLHQAVALPAVKETQWEQVRPGTRNQISALAPLSATWVTLGKVSHLPGPV